MRTIDGKPATGKFLQLMEKYRIQSITFKSVGMTLTDWTFHPEDGVDVSKKTIYAFLRDNGSESHGRFIQGVYEGWKERTFHARTGYYTHGPMFG